MDEVEPPHRIQKRPLPESAPVIAAAARRRREVLEALHPWTHSQITEHERESRLDNLLVDNDEEGV